MEKVMDNEMKESFEKLHEAQVASEKEAVKGMVRGTEKQTEYTLQYNAAMDSVRELEDMLTEVYKGIKGYQITTAVITVVAIVCLVARMIAW